jgi:hypothetical protein
LKDTYKKKVIVSLYVLGIISLLSFLLNFFETTSLKDSLVEKPDNSVSYCDQLSYKNSQYHNLSNLTSIDIEISDNKEWNVNLFKAFISLKDNNYVISEKYKKEFNSEVTFHYNNQDACKFDATTRIHGDLGDHLQANNGVVEASLNVKLLNGNVDNITKFILFIPKTRNSENEIFTTSFLRSLNFKSPETRFISTKVNNEQVEYLFQEKISKEFLEKNNLREAPIVEFYENNMWKKVLENQGNVYENLFFFAKVNNTNFMLKNINNFSTGLNALYLLNSNLLKIEWNNSGVKKVFYEVDYNKIFNNEELGMFDASLIGLNAAHGLYLNNRKFYFEPLEEKLIPIYYDGNSQFLSNGEYDIISTLREAKNLQTIIESANVLVNYLEKNNLDIDDLHAELNNYGYEISKMEIKLLIQQFVKNIKVIKNYDIKDSFPKKSIAMKPALPSKYFEIIKDELLLCESSTCKDITILETKKIIRNDFNSNGLDFKLIQNNSIAKGKFEYTKIPTAKIIKINDPEIVINQENKIISINLNSPDQRVVFIDGEMKNWEVNIDHKLNLPTSQIRNDKNLLTGCVTFKDMKFIDLKVTIKNAFCEDGLNFISSTGTIANLFSEESSFDGIDLDFSNLKIKYIKVKNSKNDCIDMSYGKYELGKLDLENCGDKGVSIGEKSNVTIDEALINRSYTGIAVKDGSYSKIQSLNSTKAMECINIFQKKQEFGPAKLSVNNLNCNENKIIIQEGSQLEND